MMERYDWLVNHLEGDSPEEYTKDAANAIRDLEARLGEALEKLDELEDLFPVSIKDLLK